MEFKKSTKSHGRPVTPPVTSSPNPDMTNSRPSAPVARTHPGRSISDIYPTLYRRESRHPRQQNDPSHHAHGQSTQPVTPIDAPLLAPRHQPRRRTLVICMIGFVIIGLGVSIPLLRQQGSSNPTAATTSGLVEIVEYQTVLPEGKTISQLGGWKRVSPPEGQPVFAYTDTLENAAISVSQQPLPEAMRHNTDSQVAELAKKFNATTTLNANNTIVYLGTSAKGPQSVILTKNDLLILMKSTQTISEAAWVEYAKSLH